MGKSAKFNQVGKNSADTSLENCVEAISNVSTAVSSFITEAK